MEIFRVSISLDFFGWSEKVSSQNIEKETKNSYLLYKERISKDKIMRLDTMFYESHKHFRYFTYCLEPDIDLAKQLLKNIIIEKIEKVEKEFKLILEFKDK